jgi:HYR domain-containing protein/IPT/TIG domain-containing protein
VTATDSCDPSPVVSCAPASGSLFAVGTTSVSCTATDLAGNVASCGFDVVVGDSTAPSMSCPVRVDVPCSGPSGALASYSVTATDVCDPSPSVFCSPASGSIFPVGNTQVTCAASDATGNAAACSFAVIVHDSTPPVLSCPPLVFVECTDPAGTTAIFAVTATDACDLAPRVTCLPASGSAFPTGRTTVACSAMDSSGNVSTCAFDVVIGDTTAPAIRCPDDVSTAAEPGGGATVTFQVTAPDACDPSPRVACVPPSGSLFPTGTTSVACTAIDAANNLSSCSFHVVVGNVAVTSILPSRGSETGGDAVALAGFGFTSVADTTVTFGGVAAIVLDVTASVVRVQTPPGTGTVDVALSDSLGSVTIPNGFVFVDPAIAARFGNVNVGRGDREDVLTMNGFVGDANREMWIPVAAPIQAEMATPSSRTSASFALYAWFGAPNSSTLKPQPFGLGSMIFPTPLTRACTPQPRRIWNNAGHRPRLGQPDFPSSPAPSVVFRRNGGFRRPIVASLQGFIRDSGSQNLGGFSITNAIVLHVTP